MKIKMNTESSLILIKGKDKNQVPLFGIQSFLVHQEKMIGNHGGKKPGPQKYRNKKNHDPLREKSDEKNRGQRETACGEKTDRKEKNQTKNYVAEEKNDG